MVLRGVFGRGSVVETWVQRNGKTHGKLKTLNPKALPTVQSYQLDFPRTRWNAVSFDTIRFRVSCRRARATLLTLDLLNKPLVSWLPMANQEPEMISVREEGIQAFGLNDRYPLIANLRVDRPGERLEFHVAPAWELGIGTNATRFAVETDAGEELVSVAFPGRDSEPPKPSWTPLSIDLDPWLGTEVKLCFRLETAATRKGQDMIALSEPHHVRPGTDSRLVLLVTSDTHRGDHLGAISPFELDTPALDGLAERGTQFTNAWSTTNITQPSHAALLTGLHPRDIKLLTNWGHLHPDALTLAETFHAAGWATYGAVSVRHLGPLAASLSQGFDRMVAPEKSTWSASNPIKYLRQRIEESDGRPVFAWLHLFDAHDPYTPPPEFDRRYYPSDRDPGDSAFPGIPEGRSPAHLSSTRDPEYPLAQYRAEIAYLDEELGGLLALPRVNAGHVAFTSDHGEILNDMGIYFNHSLSVPSTLHVPLILAGPDVPQTLSLIHI